VLVSQRGRDRDSCSANHQRDHDHGIRPSLRAAGEAIPHEFAVRVGMNVRCGLRTHEACHCERLNGAWQSHRIVTGRLLQSLRSFAMTAQGTFGAISPKKGVSRAVSPLDSSEWGKSPKEDEERGDDENRITSGNLRRNQLNRVSDGRCVVGLFWHSDADDEIRIWRTLNHKDLKAVLFEEVP